ncbi:hypothetical protein BV372_24745 [Nostoc sp. T09]|uniref:hypothetical protein n=1 Tax=Nostoc sp. T09 TaxID=1932621 RepID=UPI000A3BD284|nr:hypothetical protein [Nostoc sp. T09]OUL28608.1 hypothetical protein BV372_24745 [Nostoc sp. T09]
MNFLSWRYQLRGKPLTNQKLPDASAAFPLLFPGAAIDADEMSLFHQTIDRGIAKRELNSGKLLWTLPTPGVPLAVVGQHLWLIEGTGAQFRILALNTETGETVHTSTWFDMLLGLPAIFDYNHYQELSVNVEAGWAASAQNLWIRIDGGTRYAGGVDIGPLAAESRKAISMLVQIIPATANISLAKTNHIDGLGEFMERQQDDELPIPFPNDCVQVVPVNSSLMSSQKHWVVRSAQLSNYVVLLQILPVDNFSSPFLLLRVFSSDLKRLLWQQPISNYYEEPARC